jgi:hypothetical protein
MQLTLSKQVFITFHKKPNAKSASPQCLCHYKPANIMHYPAGHWGWLWLLIAATPMPYVTFYAAVWSLTNGDLSSKENWC